MLRVLVVDDDTEARTSLIRQVARMAEVELTGAAADVPESREALRDDTPDLVVVDLHRREDREEGLCQGLRELTDAPIVVLASFMTAERWSRVRAAGAMAFLLKHIGTERLERELTQLGRDGTR